MFLAGVNDEQRAGQLLHFADAAQVVFQLFALVLQLDDFLLGQQLELALLFHLVDLVQTLHAGADGAEIGQHTAQPAVVDIVHVAALRFGSDALLSLLLGADEQDALAFHGQVAHEIVGFVHLADGLLQVDDVDAIALGEDVRGHFGVPAASLMTEVHARFQELFHGNNCHLGFLLVVSTLCVASARSLRRQAKHKRAIDKGA